jgi:glycosyltransferase involved in cell wall biosynthesis
MEANSANKFFDALAAGKPIMINYKGWQAKLIEKYNVGIVVPSNNVSLAAKELEKLITDKKRLLSNGKAAKELGIKLFDRDKLYKLFENVFINVSK